MMTLIGLIILGLVALVASGSALRGNHSNRQGATFMVFFAVVGALFFVVGQISSLAA